jgi:glycosyltransferase involved in cell wall biosynthesis
MIMETFRVLLAINNQYLPQFIGGAEFSAHNLALNLRLNGHEVAVLGGMKAYDRLWFQHGLQKYILHRKIGVDKVMGYPVYRAWHPANELEQFVDEYKPDVLIIVGGSGVSIPAFSKLRLACPTIVTVEDVEFSGNNEHILRFKDAAFVANSQFTARRIKETFGIDAFVLRPLVNPGSCRVAKPGRKVVMVNPIAVKGLPVALGLAEARPDIPFLFQESWGYKNQSRDELVRRISTLKNIELRRPTFNPRMFFREARIMLVPSMWDEAWCRVVTEAHVSGIPVLGSNAGALPESIGPGGLLVDRNASLDEWVNALAKIWDDNQVWEKFSAAAMKYSIRDEVVASSQIKSFEGLIKNLVNSRSRICIHHHSPDE